MDVFQECNQTFRKMNEHQENNLLVLTWVEVFFPISICVAIKLLQQLVMIFSPFKFGQDGVEELDK